MGLTRSACPTRWGKPIPATSNEPSRQCRTATQTTFGLHLHNTYGMGLANVVAGLSAALSGTTPPWRNRRLSVRPWCRWQHRDRRPGLHADSMGIETGIDLEVVTRCNRSAEALSSPLESSVSRALGWAV